MAAKTTSTGSGENRYSMPLDTTTRATQISRGRFVDRTSKASWIRARDDSVTTPENHCQGSSPAMRKRKYGSCPSAPRGRM